MSITTHESTTIESSATKPAEVAENAPKEEEKPKEVEELPESKKIEAEIDEKPDEDDKAPKKKNRKHKRKERKNKIIDERALAIKIMRKSSWKKMRNEYLNLERQKAKEVKKSLQESRKVNVKSQLVKFSPVINFYKSPSGQDPDNSHDAVAEEKNDGDVKSGSIVNIKFREVCHDLKELRQEFRQFSYVKHVEIVENGAQCNVRVLNEQNADDLMSLYTGCEHTTAILSGDAEDQYWNRMTEIKENNKRKHEEKPTLPKKQRRGREKLTKMIMKACTPQHIRFDVE